MLGIEVEEHFDLFSDGKFARLLCLVQQDVVRCIARLGIEERAKLAYTRIATVLGPYFLRFSSAII